MCVSVGCYVVVLFVCSGVWCVVCTCVKSVTDQFFVDVYIYTCSAASISFHCL